MKNNRKHFGCYVDGCDGEHLARGLCKKHYRRMKGYNKRRYQVVKNNPELGNSSWESHKKWVENNIDKYKLSKKLSDRKYYDKNKEKLLEYRKNRL